MTLQARLSDPSQFVMLYGATPPRADAPPERIDAAADRLAKRARALPLDGLLIYDVQDESDRTNEPRPFPFLPTIESRVYAHMLQERIGMPVISYKAVTNMTEATWEEWLTETQQQYGLSYLSLVGSSNPDPTASTLPVKHATIIAAGHAGDFTLGGVVIAERHSPDFNESHRLLRKADQGIEFFVSQVVYDANVTIRLLHDYTRDCHERGIAPRRIVLTFSPCGRAKTMTFIKWLGVAIAPDVEHTILSDPAPFRKANQICRDNLRAILDQSYIEQIPLGVNIESVSIHKDEIEASIDLFHTLHEVAHEYGLDGERLQQAAVRR